MWRKFPRLKTFTTKAENKDDWAMHNTETMPDWRDIERDDKNNDCLI
ncbi:MAG: hypothetical protein IJR46_05715 [Neisseriaceae bacterium]|nr:hypothetical protein [Neisseriaceae bacterium]